MGNLGFRTQNEAIIALHEDGISPIDIAERIGCSRSNVYARIKEYRDAQIDWEPARLEKLARIHRAAMDIIAEAFAISAQDIPRLLKAAAARQPAQERKAAEPVASTNSSLPAARAKEDNSAKQVRQYRFVGLADGQFLDGNGQFTSDPAAAWSGSAEDGKRMRNSWGNARFCKLREVA